MTENPIRVIRVNIEKVVIFEPPEIKFIFLIPDKVLKEYNIHVDDYVQIFLRKIWSKTLTDELKLQVKNSNNIEQYYPEVDLYIQNNIKDNFYIDLTSWEILSQKWRKQRRNDLQDLIMDDEEFLPFELDIKIIE
ncbi:MAG: hypothetical protein EU549_00670 [Promethearchaeota archaeon]|nr:MAG: hypothetical protein EU549_00670 [Candidatus Lokiarchaeota archaeon]